MFKSNEGTLHGEQSRAAILENALRLFRSQGFDQTRMRDIAKAAEVALGAAYYYFPSKDAMIMAYYDSVQSEHERRVSEALTDANLTLRARMGIVFHSKLDILQSDRKLLGGIFRYTGEPDHPLSCLGPATESSRRHSIALFARALEGERLPADVQELLPVALWALHMGILIFFIYDLSPQQERTRKLIDGALDLIVRLLSLATLPFMTPVRGKVLALLRDVDLLPHGGTSATYEVKEEL